MAESAEEIRKHVRVYILVFAALAVLTVVTVGVSYIQIESVAATVLIALFIASIKAGLVAGYFMHLVSERRIIFWVLALTVAFFAVLMLLPSITEFSGAGEMVDQS
ncbi:MAG: cytochrome C oxidase subunit IV family protein [Candidatus Latescibacteria bacterium]|nr:cytochrome C oxidase subunit IV family protein [Candidatus Latescibacterota bacterium]